MNKDDKKRTHIIVTGKGGGGGSDAGAVRFDEAQTLTSAEQLQARENIGVPTEWFGTQAEYDLIDPKDPNTVYHIEGGAPVQSDWNEADNTSLAYIQNKPTIPTKTSELTNDSGFTTFDGDYNSLTNKPDLATVATSGDYDDLQNKPTIPVVPTNVSAFTNDAGYTTFDGDYNSLTNKPTIPAAQVNSDWNASSGVAQILNKPTLATVATTGSYNDLSNKPTIPAAQVQSDWNQSDNTQVDYIKNKPNITPTPPMAIEALTFTLQSGTVKTVEFYTVPNYFYVEDVSGADNTLTIKKRFDNSPTIEVFKSTDKVNWTSMGSTSTTGITATIPANGKLYLKCTTNTWSGTGNLYNSIVTTGKCNVGGNIMSLLYGDNFEGKTTFPTGSTYNFNNLFDGISFILRNINNLILPATTLTESCYRYMFSGCRALTTAPALPATTLATNCYSYMFNNCNSINSVTTYAQDISASNCLSGWLNSVAATGTFYNMACTTYPEGASGIPSGWTEHHTTASTINVTITNTGDYTGATYQIDSGAAQPINETGTTSFTVPATATTLTIHRNGKGVTDVLGICGYSEDSHWDAEFPVNKMTDNVSVDLVNLM